MPRVRALAGSAIVALVGPPSAILEFSALIPMYGFPRSRGEGRADPDFEAVSMS